MTKKSNELSVWLSPKTLIPIILALISLIGVIITAKATRKTSVDLQLSKQEVSIIARDLGYAMNDLEQFNRAKTLLEIALRYSPQDGDIHSSLGHSHYWIALNEKSTNSAFAKSHFEKAVNYYREAFNINNGEISREWNQYKLGAALLHLGKVDEAQDNLLQAHKFLKYSYPVNRDIGELYLAKKESQLAIKWLNTADSLLSTNYSEHERKEETKYLNKLISQAMEIQEHMR